MFHECSKSTTGMFQECSMCSWCTCLYIYVYIHICKYICVSVKTYAMDSFPPSRALPGSVYLNNKMKKTTCIYINKYTYIYMCIPFLILSSRPPPLPTPHPPRPPPFPLLRRPPFPTSAMQLRASQRRMGRAAVCCAAAGRTAAAGPTAAGYKGRGCAAACHRLHIIYLCNNRLGGVPQRHELRLPRSGRPPSRQAVGCRWPHSGQWRTT